MTSKVSSTAHTGSPNTVDGAELRSVMARFTTGIAILTTGGEKPHGMTANAVSSVSLDPPLVLCCVTRTARLHAAIMASDGFAVSVLADEHAELARYFADKRRPEGAAQFAGGQWSTSRSLGAPVLSGALSWLECRLAGVYKGGDHSICLGEVLSAGRGTERPALVFYGGGFHRFESA